MNDLVTTGYTKKHVVPATDPNGSDLNARLIRLDRIRTAKGWPEGQITGRNL